MLPIFLRPPQANGGLLPSKAQLYDAITYMVAALTYVHHETYPFLFFCY